MTKPLPRPGQVLRVARSQLGYHESPAGSNRNKYSDYWNHPPEPWCADWACWVLEKADALDVPMSAYTPTLHQYYADRNRADRGPRVGALVFFEFPGMGRISHVGIVEAILNDGGLVVLEGNTDEAGGRTGGKVMRHERRAYIAGYGYPKYRKDTDAPYPTLRLGDHGPAVKYLQKLLVAYGFRLKVDGQFGAHTEAAVNSVKRRAGYARNGVAGHRTWHFLVKNT